MKGQKETSMEEKFQSRWSHSHISVLTLRVLDFVNNAEIAGMVASVSNEDKEGTDTIFWKQDLLSQSLTEDLHCLFIFYIIIIKLAFKNALVLHIINKYKDIIIMK